MEEGQGAGGGQAGRGKDIHLHGGVVAKPFRLDFVEGIDVARLHVVFKACNSLDEVFINRRHFVVNDLYHDPELFDTIPAPPHQSNQSISRHDHQVIPEWSGS
eukprot:COSAG05_NODE_3_length_51333_cov_129.132080_13_plen_103_part_00